MELKIGSDHNNDIVIHESTVGRYHAVVVIHNPNTIIIKDLSSKNGIKVNDRRVRQFQIKEDDKIELGNHLVETTSIFKEIKDRINKTRTDFTDEYKVLLLQLSEYDSKKNKLIKSPLLPVLIRLGLGLLVIIVLVAFPEVIPNDGVRIGIMMSVGIVSALASTVMSRSDKKKEKLDLLKLEYEDLLVCPKCHTSFVSQSTVYMKGRRRCINNRCDAVYSISN